MPVQIQNSFAEYKARIHGWAERNPEAVVRIALWAEDELGAASEGEAAPIDLLRSFMEALMPRNWWELGIGAHRGAQDLMESSGLCLVWVPEAKVIREMLAAGDKAARDEALLANSASILASVETVLGETTRPELASQKLLGEEAILAFRAGATSAAQALSASILTAAIQEHFGFRKFSLAREAFSAETADGPWRFRRATVQRAICAAIVRSDQMAPEAGFNRHLSTHGTEPTQFTSAHSLAALMLVAGSLRELQEIYRVGTFGFGPTPRLELYAGEQFRERLTASTSAD
jgi:hypothetical protein